MFGDDHYTHVTGRSDVKLLGVLLYSYLGSSIADRAACLYNTCDNKILTGEGLPMDHGDNVQRKNITIRVHTGHYKIQSAIGLHDVDVFSAHDLTFLKNIINILIVQTQ